MLYFVLHFITLPLPSTHIRQTAASCRVVLGCIRKLLWFSSIHIGPNHWTIPISQVPRARPICPYHHRVAVGFVNYKLFLMFIDGLFGKGLSLKKCTVHFHRNWFIPFPLPCFFFSFLFISCLFLAYIKLTFQV